MPPTIFKQIEDTVNKDIPKALSEVQCGGWNMSEHVGDIAGGTGVIAKVKGVPGRNVLPLKNGESGMGWRVETGGKKDDGFQFPRDTIGLATACEPGGSGSVMMDVWCTGQKPDKRDCKIKVNYPKFTDPPCQWWNNTQHSSEPMSFIPPGNWPVACKNEQLLKDFGKWLSDNNVFSPSATASLKNAMDAWWSTQNMDDACDWEPTQVIDEFLSFMTPSLFNPGIVIPGVTPDQVRFNFERWQTELATSSSSSVSSPSGPGGVPDSTCKKFMDWTNEAKYQYEDCPADKVVPTSSGSSTYKCLNGKQKMWVCSKQPVSEDDGIYKNTLTKFCVGEECRCPGDKCIIAPKDILQVHPYKSYVRAYQFSTERLGPTQAPADALKKVEGNAACYGLYDEFDPKTRVTGVAENRCVLFLKGVNPAALKNTQVGKGFYSASSKPLDPLAPPDPASTVGQRSYNKDTDLWYRRLGAAFSLLSKPLFRNDITSALNEPDTATVRATVQRSTNVPPPPVFPSGCKSEDTVKNFSSWLVSNNVFSAIRTQSIVTRMKEWFNKQQKPMVCYYTPSELMEEFSDWLFDTYTFPDLTEEQLIFNFDRWQTSLLSSSSSSASSIDYYDQAWAIFSHLRAIDDSASNGATSAVAMGSQSTGGCNALVIVDTFSVWLTNSSLFTALQTSSVVSYIQEFWSKQDPAIACSWDATQILNNFLGWLTTNSILLTVTQNQIATAYSQWLATNPAPSISVGTGTQGRGTVRPFTMWWQQFETDVNKFFTPPKITLRLPSLWATSLQAFNPTRVTPGTTQPFSVEVEVQAKDGLVSVLASFMRSSLVLPTYEEPVPVVVPLGSPTEFRARAEQWKEWKERREEAVAAGTKDINGQTVTMPSEVDALISRLEEYAVQIEQTRKLRAELATAVSKLATQQSGRLLSISKWEDENIKAYNLYQDKLKGREQLLNYWKLLRNKVAEFDDVINMPWCRNDRFTTPIYSLLDPWMPGRPDLYGGEPTCAPSSDSLPRLCLSQAEQNMYIDLSNLKVPSGSLKIPVLKPIQVRLDIPTPPDAYEGVIPNPKALELPALPPVPSIAATASSQIFPPVTVVSKPTVMNLPEPTNAGAAANSIIQALAVITVRNKTYDDFWKSLIPDANTQALKCVGWQTETCVHVEMDLLERLTRIVARPAILLQEDLTLPSGRPRVYQSFPSPNKTATCWPEDQSCSVLLPEQTNPRDGWQIIYTSNSANDPSIQNMKDTMRRGTIGSDGKIVGDVPYDATAEQLYPVFDVPRGFSLTPTP